MERIDIGHAVADIRSFYEDKDGRIWIGSEFGVYIYDHGKVVRPAMENGALGHAVVFSMLEQAGRMLMGTYSKGIIIFDRATGRYDTIATGKGLPSPDINQILTDHEGGLWIATPYGLTYLENVYHPDKMVTYDERHGLADRHIRAIQEDSAGRIWVSTYSGIACFDRQK